MWCVLYINISPLSACLFLNYNILLLSWSQPMTSYFNDSEQFSIYVMVIFIISVIIIMTSILFAVSQLLPVIIDIMIPVNESRSTHLANMTFIIIRYNNSSYFALFSLIIVNILGAIVMTTTETTYMILCQHLVGMFTIAG